MGEITSDDKNTDKIVLTQGPFEQLREELTVREETEADEKETIGQTMGMTVSKGETNAIITESGDEYLLEVDS